MKRKKVKPKKENKAIFQILTYTGLMALVGFVIVYGAFKIFNLKSTNYDEFKIEAKNSNNNKLSLNETKPGDYWVYVRTYDRYAVDPESNAGRSKRGDVVEIMPANYLPSDTEQRHWAIFKVNDLTTEEIEKYTAPWEEGDSQLAYRQYKLNIDKLALNIGLNDEVNFSSFKSQLALKTNDDLLAYEQGRQQFAKYHKVKTLAWKVRDFIFPHSLAAQQTETSSINKTGQDYDTLTLWEDATDYDLTASNTGDGAIEIAECYDDGGALDDIITVSGATNNSTNYRKITVPESERHNGTASGGGFTIDPTTAGAPVTIVDSNTIVEWLNITGFYPNGTSGTTGIALSGTSTRKNMTVRYNLVHDNATNSNPIRGISAPNNTHKIYNNIVFNLLSNTSYLGTYGINVGGNDGVNNTVYAINNTGMGVATGFVATEGVGVLVNNIAMDCEVNFSSNDDDFYFASGTDYNACSGSTCSAGDGDAFNGTHDLTNLNSDDLFVDKANGDLHLKAGASVINAGSDLSAVFATDIDYGLRGNSWDIGADEYNTSGGGSDACTDGTAPNQCSANKPFYCENGNLINKCSQCNCNTGYSCSTDGTTCFLTPLPCPDGTAHGQCSTTKPKYCDNGNLINKCNECGCNNSYNCQTDGSCLFNPGNISDHPRIWINNSVMATLTARKNANKIQWQRLKTWADRTKPVGGQNPTNGYAATTQFALVYLMAGETKYADAAIYWMDTIKVNVPSIDMIASYLKPFSITYDWLYNYLTPEQRADYRAVINNWVNELHTNSDYSGYYSASFGNYSQRMMTAEAFAGYALLGDDPNAQSYINNALAHWVLIKAAFNLSAGDGASFQGEDYGNSGIWPFTSQFLGLMTFMTGEDYYAGTIFEKRLQFLINNLWPGLNGTTPVTKNFRNGDYQGWRMRYSSIRTQFLFLANRYYDTYGRYAYWLLNNNSNLNTNTSDLMYNERDLDFLFFDPDKNGTNISELPTAYYANNVDGVGVTIMRSDWGDNQTYIGYICGNLIGGGHQDLDQGSFQIYSHKRELAISSGSYDGDGGSNASRWYNGRTISQNSLLIYNPNEHWDNSVRGNCDVAAYGNDGGQRDISGKNAYGQEAPQMCSTAALWETFRTRNELCDYKAFKHTSDFDYIDSDLTNAYNGPIFQSDPDCYPSNWPKNIVKVTKVNRQLAYLRGDNEYIVIFDNIVSTNAGFKKTWLLHMIDQPALNGSETIVEGVSTKGIIQSNNSDLVTVTAGDRKMFSKTLLPANPITTRIGGVAGTEHTATDYDQWLAGSNHYLYGDFYGKWRVEVSPSVSQTDDNFLTVLHPTSSSGSMPPTTLITSSDGMKGALIADSNNPRIVMFSPDGTNHSSVTYDATYSGIGKHLLVNITPGTYDIYKNRINITSATVGSDGALAFDSAGGSIFQVVNTGDLPPVPNCGEGAITTTCKCNGIEQTYGYCCSGSWQSTVCPLTCPNGQIACDNQCVPLICVNNSQCNDNNNDTTDTCLYPNTCNANCQHQYSTLEISNVSITNRTTNSAIISWSTTRNSNSLVQYGLTNQYGQSKINDSLVTTHSQELTNLTTGATYHFLVKSVDALGNSATSQDYTFTTLQVGAPPAPPTPPGDDGGGGSAPDVDEGQFSDFIATKKVAINIANNSQSLSSLLGFKTAYAQNRGASFSPWQQLASWHNLLTLISLITTIALVIFLFFFSLSIILFIYRVKKQFGYYPNFSLVLHFIFRHPFYSLKQLTKQNKHHYDPYHYWFSKTAGVSFYGAITFVIVKIIVIVLLLNVFTPSRVLAETNFEGEGNSVKKGDRLTYQLKLMGVNVGVQSISDLIPNGTGYVPNSLYLNDTLQTDTCADNDNACFNQNGGYNGTVEFKNILMDTQVYFTVEVLGTANPVVNVALGNSVSNPLTSDISQPGDQTNFSRLIKGQEIQFVDQGVNKSLTIEEIGENSITFTYEGASYTLTIGESKEINGLTFTLTNLGEIAISRGAYQPPTDQNADQPDYLPRRNEQKFNSLGEELSAGTLNRIMKAVFGEKQANEINNEISQEERNKLIWFITYGLPDLEPNWRLYAGVLQKYAEIYNHVPITDAHWQDIKSIINGRKPVERKFTREIWAGAQFIKVYHRMFNFQNKYDDIAIWIAAYDLRLKPANRNLQSERAAINTFKVIYGRLPLNGDDWDIVRMVAYSGAKR